MAFDEENRDKIREALDLDNNRKWFPSVELPSKKETELVQASYSLERENKEKLARMAKKQGYGKSTSAFLNDWIASVKE